MRIKRIKRWIKLKYLWVFNRKEYWQVLHNPLPVWRHFDKPI